MRPPTTTRGRVVGDPAPLVATPARVPRDRDGRVDLDACVAALGAVDVLDSGDGRGWSYLLPHGRWRLVDDGARTRLEADGHAVRDLGADPFLALERVAEQVGAHPEAEPEPDLPPVSGGLVGALAYDLNRRVERLPDTAVADRDTAHLSLRVVEVVCALPPARDHALLLVRPLPTALHPAGNPRDRAATLLAAATDRLARAAGVHPGTGGLALPPPRPQPAWTSLPRERHLAAIEQVLAAIGAGAVFQVNLAQRLSARWEADVHALYRALRAASPAAFGAVLPDVGVASISPETFLAVDRRHVVTRPIKGTRPRAGDAALDAALADDLATATKDRAENVMVVDLERNDLGRVCTPGSIQVPELARVEGHPTVWHLVSTVSGELAPGTGYGQLLRATFPCGSITGAPKVAAMGLIETLEGVRRGMYCGALGALSPGHARLSVAIRTAVLHPDRTVDHGAGGGIVADSDPVEEHAETLDKAAAFLRAVAATHVIPHPAAGEPR